MKITKKVLSILLSVIMVLGVYAVAPITASAEFYTVDGIKWCYEVLEDGRSVRIVYGSEPSNPETGAIVGSITIPGSIIYEGTEYTVKEIGDGAFNSTVDYSGITSITIPASVETIGDRAFYNLNNLVSVILYENSALKSIGVSAFYGCKNLSSINIPQGVTSIGNYAFYNCQNLSSVVIPDNVTTFGTYVFRNCTNLQSAVIGANVTSLNGTFINCGNLESVIIRGNDVAFSGYPFYGCSNLTSITIPCNFDKNSFSPSSSSYINIPET
ncbi:MAG: leucine-rich repeat domain-containing protein, partial [Clostridia bacterium]|nr:leucine-rich repeat domain-containing protein [Clostridia bacterium]